jgi:heterodisulfide reductase subunit A
MWLKIIGNHRSTGYSGCSSIRVVKKGASFFMSTHTSGSVMVVGAGISGMQCALDLAESGYYVYLVEKEPAIGGLMSQLDKTFPTNDCAM